MNLMGKCMVVAALFASGAHLCGSAAQKPVKIEMIKTDFATRGKPWQYQVDVQGDNNWSNIKTIKNDAKISFVAGATKLRIIAPTRNNPLDQTITKDYVKNKIALDREGNISAKSAAEIKNMIAASKNASSGTITGDKEALADPVQIKLLISTKKVRAPFTVKSAKTPDAKALNYTDAVVVTTNNEKESREIVPGKLEESYIVNLKVEKVAAGTQNAGSYIKINDGIGKRIIIRNEEGKKFDQSRQLFPYQDEVESDKNLRPSREFAARKDEVTDGSIVRMGTSENVFFVVPQPQQQVTQ